MRVVFFNRFFFPDASATSQMVSDLAFGLAAGGHAVEVVASGAAHEVGTVERVRGLTIHRVAAASGGPQGLLAKGAAYLAYYRGARQAARRLFVPGTVAVVMTDPPLLATVITPLARKRGTRVVQWLQDVFPEVAREFGIPGMAGPLGRLVRARRDRSLRRADRIVAISERMARGVSLAVPEAGARVEVIHNWADGRAVTPVDAADNVLRHRWGLADHFVVAYSGNFGRVHEFGTLLDAAALLRSEPRVTFLMIGRGPRLADVKSRVQREGLANVRFEAHQERESLAQSLGVADAHVCVLASRFEGLVMPSKLYGIMAAGRPTLFIGHRDDDCARILVETQSGAAVAEADAGALAEAILRLRDDAAECARTGARARQAFEQRYDFPIALARWAALLRELDAGAPPGRD